LKYLTLSWLLLIACPCLGQNKVKLDSLELQLTNASHDTTRIQVLLAMASTHSATDLPQAVAYARQAYDIAVDRKDARALAITSRALANYYFSMSDYKNASVFFFDALRQYETLRDTVGELTMYINLGAIRDRLLEFDKALEFYLKAQAMVNQADLDNKTRLKLLPSLYNNIANIYQTKRDFSAAEQYYTKTLNLAHEAGNKRVEGIALNNLGKLYYLDLNKPDEAIDFLLQGLAVRQELGDKSELAKSYLQLSVYYLRQKKLEEARDVAAKALALGQEVGSLDIQRDGYMSLSDIEEADGNLAKALQSFRSFKTLSDSIQNQLAGGELARLQLQYDFEKAEQARTQEREQLRTRYTITIIILAAFLIIAVLLVIVVRARARQTELRQRNLTQDVEIKNKELTTNVMYLIRKNELINDVAERLLNIKQSFTPENQKAIHDIILDLQREADSDTWKEFEMRFKQVHSDFYDKLRKLYPGLSPADEKLCAFLRLNMTSKDIAAITKQSVKSVEVARARLRKKLNLTNTTSNLVTHLSGL
jgi:tetratricopeptide (TPR) repeat protein